LASFVGIWIAGLCALVWRDVQRAEYLADYLASRVSGTDSMISLLKKLHLSGAFDIVVRALRFQHTNRDLFEELRFQVERVPDREIERLMRIEKLLQAGLDSTHPPTAYRIEFLEAHHSPDAKVVVSPATWERVEAELGPARRWAHEKMLEFHASQPHL
jgi:heat shock protein HtpX